MNTRKRNTGFGTVLVAVCLMTAACSSAASGGSSADAGSGSASPGAQAATAFLAANTANPTSVGPTETLTAKPSAGKTVINLTVPLAAAQRQSDSMAQGAALLGWRYTALDAGATPASASSAFEAALARKPDAITYSGFPSALFTQQLAKAKAAGITVLTNSTGEGNSDGVLAELGGVDQLAVYGRIAAAYFAANAPEKSETVLVSISAYPIFTGYIRGFEEGVKDGARAARPRSWTSRLPIPVPICRRTSSPTCSGTRK